jgi:hypothetical protein
MHPLLAFSVTKTKRTFCSLYYSRLTQTTPEKNAAYFSAITSRRENGRKTPKELAKTDFLDKVWWRSCINTRI